MLAIGINLEETVFSWVKLDKREAKLSEITYGIFRCNLAHGTEVPPGFEIELRKSEQWRSASVGQQQLVLPDTIVFALLSVAVFCPANADQQIGAGHFLSHDTTRFIIDEWWGREADARSYFSRVKLPRVTMKF